MPPCVYCGERAGHRETSGARRAFCNRECQLAMVGGRDDPVIVKFDSRLVTIVCKEQHQSVTIQVTTAKLSNIIGNLIDDKGIEDPLPICSGTAVAMNFAPIFKWFTIMDASTDEHAMYRVKVSPQPITDASLASTLDLAILASYLDIPSLLDEIFDAYITFIDELNHNILTITNAFDTLVGKFDIATLMNFYQWRHATSHEYYSDVKDDRKEGFALELAIGRSKSHRKIEFMLSVVSQAAIEYFGPLLLTEALTAVPMDQPHVLYLRELIEKSGYPAIMSVVADNLLPVLWAENKTNTLAFTFLVQHISEQGIAKSLDNLPFIKFMMEVRNLEPASVVNVILATFTTREFILRIPSVDVIRYVFTYATNGQHESISYETYYENVINILSHFASRYDTSRTFLTYTNQLLLLIEFIPKFKSPFSFADWAYLVLVHLVNVAPEAEHMQRVVASYISPSTPIDIVPFLKLTIMGTHPPRLFSRLLTFGKVSPKQIIHDLFMLLDSDLELVAEITQHPGSRLHQVEYIMQKMVVDQRSFKPMPEYLNLMFQFFTKDEVPSNRLRTDNTLFILMNKFIPKIQQKGVEDLAMWKTQFVNALASPKRKTKIPAEFINLVKNVYRN